MAVARKTLDFLPSVFQSDTNNKFLGSTLDQLINEPDQVRVDGYIGRRFGTISSGGYLQEPTADRSNYQLEPSVVIGDPGQVTLIGDYSDTINRIDYYGGITSNHDRLFRNQYYSFDPQIDLDKLANYSQYYWLPNGPYAIQIGSSDVNSANNYIITGTVSGYTTNNTGAAVNPELRLVRGRTYTFTVNEPGKAFWIQTEPGNTGVSEYEPNTSTRFVYGVTNNGVSIGVVTFTVPAASAQNSYYLDSLIDYVDFATSNTFSSLDGANWTTLTTIDGDSLYPQDRYVIFTTTSNSSVDWTTRTGATVPTNQRRGLWRINIDIFSKLTLTYVRGLDTSGRISIRHGINNQGKEFVYNGTVLTELYPPTAPLTTLYYQNGSDTYKQGLIRIVDQDTDIINVDSDIIGQDNYSFNGLVLSNGMKITFDNSVLPSGYRNRTFIVEGVGTAIKLIDFERLVAPEVEIPGLGIPFDSTPFDSVGFDQAVGSSVEPDYIVANRASIDENAWARGNRWFHIDVIRQASLANNFAPNFGTRATRPIIEYRANLQLFGSGRIGMGLIDQFFDSTTTLFVNGRTQQLTDITAQIDNVSYKTLRAQKLAVEPGQLVVFGNDINSTRRATKYLLGTKDQSAAVSYDGTLIGSVTTRAGSTRVVSYNLNTNFLVQLSIGSYIYSSAGLYLGRVAQIYNNYELDLVDSLSINYNNLTGLRYNDSRLAYTSLELALPYSTLVVRSGINRGRSYYLTTDNTWRLGQQKTSINQYPYYDVILPVSDQSLGSFYYNSRFVGTKIFGYTLGASRDPVLGLLVKYINNSGTIGDLEFTNYYDTDKFDYSLDPYGLDIATGAVSQGVLRLIEDRYTYSITNCWAAVDTHSRQYQHIQTEYTGSTNYFEIGASPITVGVDSAAEPSLKVYINNNLLIRTRPGNTDSYSYQATGLSKTLRIDLALLSVGDRIDIFVLSNDQSSQGYYTLPKNLEFNPLNETIERVSLGQMRNHLIVKASGLQGLLGNPRGANNIRDIDHSLRAGTILQHSAPVALATASIIDERVNFYSGLDYARREYTRFKNRFLELSVSLPNINPVDPIGGVDLILSSINSVKNSSFAFYYSDMLPYGNDYRTLRYRILNTTVRNYTISLIFSADSASNRAVMLYLNNSLLVIGRDYTFSETSPMVILSDSLVLAVNDNLEIREYNNTDGCFIPETPTKLGLHPKYIPARYLDDTYVDNIYVIQGHDGSIIPAFNDYRDNFILELENRIYNNIKVNYNQVRPVFDALLPGRFRSSDYTLDEFNSIVTTEFLRWVGTNQTNYLENNTFQSNNEFTWNFSLCRDQNDQKVPGHWRGIYRYFYDTDRPHTHPWEMLGYTVKPTWWDTYYSWTNNIKRTALITACTNGYTQNPASSTPTVANPVYARAGFADIVPVDSTGNLRSPLILIKQHNSATFSQSWAIGDLGPAESAWRRSSEYPFALQKAFSLMRSSYFAIAANINNYYEFEIGTFRQYLVDTTRRRLTLDDIKINGAPDSADSIIRSASYFNWIHGYLTSLGIDAGARLTEYIGQIRVNLTHKLAAFTDKSYINVLTEQTSPGSSNQSIVIPDEDYFVHLNRSAAIAVVKYSAVIVQKTPTGFAISGYDLDYPYFGVILGQRSGKSYSIQVLDQTVTVFEDFETTSYLIPYGSELTSLQQMAEFLVSYQRYLQSQGLIFDQYDSDLNLVRDFTLSIREFLTWNLQGWRENNIIVLSPLGDSINIYSDNSQIDHIRGNTSGSRLLGINFNPIRSTDFTVLRDGFITKLLTVSGQTVAFAEFNLVQYEHALVFNNRTVFNDIVYEPALGTRQLRLRIVGSITNNWDGQYTPPGFVYNDSKVDDWVPGHDYKKGDIVKYKNLYYSAVKDTIATDSFNINSWYRLESAPRSGLLKNFATNAAQSQEIYNIDQPPYDEQLFKFSSGLIGFRSREYLTNLGISPISQTKFYQGFIHEKGTRSAASALARAQVDGQSHEIEIYEEWAARVGEYGAVDAKPSIKFAISDTITDIDPVTLLFQSEPNEVTDSRIIAVRTSDLLSATRDFDGNLFRYRDPVPVRNYRIELFGDGIICGRNPAFKADALFYACLTDQQTGRVTNPPDSLLFDSLNQKFRVSVTTRSREGSTSTELLQGTDGVNAAWPDNIQADIVVINHGLMDAKFGTPLDVYRQNLTNMRNLLTADQIVIWMTPTKIDVANSHVNWASFGGTTNIDAYAQVMRDVAKIYGDPVADANGINNWLFYLRNNISFVYENEIVVPGDDISFTIATPDQTAVYYYTVVDASYLIESSALYVDSGGSIDLTVTSDLTGQTLYWTIETPTAEDLSRTVVDTDFSDGIHPRQEGYNLLINQVLAPTIEAAITKSIRLANAYYPDDLITAGYASVNEVDAQLFDINNLKSFGRQIVSSISNGFKIWVAKDYNYQWQVYRLFKIAGTITDVQTDLDRKIIFVVNNQHGLVAGDYFAVRGLGTNIDGFYVVFSSDDFTLTAVDDNVYETIRNFNLVSDTAELYDFQPLRFPTLAARDAASPRHGWISSDIVYIDDIGDVNSSWAVYDRIDRYNIAASDSILEPDSDIDFSVTSPLDEEVDLYYSILSNYQLDYTVPIFTPGIGALFRVLAPDNRELYYTIQNAINIPEVEQTAPLDIYAGQDSWTLTRQQISRIDIDSVNEIFLYSKKDQKILARLDILDPAKGRILGAAQADIDYTTEHDPAKYNVGTDQDVSIASDFYWAAEHVGQYWWHVGRCRFINYEQDSLSYRLDNWGSLFSDSSVEIYEWIESDLLPSEHVEQGRKGLPLYANNQAYTEHAFVNPENNIVTVRYYFWVRDTRTPASNSKIYSSHDLESVIKNPRLTDIAYAALLDRNAIALYNVEPYIKGSDTVLHITYNRNSQAGLIHTDYRLIRQGSELDQFPIRIESKLIDSLCGLDLLSRTVPDARLNSYEQIGLDIRPRQTLIVNRRAAVENVVRYVNQLLISRPLASRIIDRDRIYSDYFYSQEPIPASSEYDQIVDYYRSDIGSDLRTPTPTANLRVLVRQDLTAGGYWTIRKYDITNTDPLIERRYRLVRRQSYDTRRIWNFVDWYAAGYSSRTVINRSVDNNTELAKLDLQVNEIIRVTNRRTELIIGTYLGSDSRPGLFELYRVDLVDNVKQLTLIGLEQGTLQLTEQLFGDLGWDGAGFDSDYYDFNFGVEFRAVLLGLKQDVFINDLALYYNLTLFYLVEYILSEQKNIDWMFKTSFVSVLHRVQGLLQSPNFVRDRQSSYEKYLNEVKPYRVKIREYITSYSNLELTRLHITDFDLPAYWDRQLQILRSPNSEYPVEDQARLQGSKYLDWTNNHKYLLGRLDIYATGYGYEADPTPQVAVIRRDLQTGSNASARIQVNNLTSGIGKVYIDNPGGNYTLTPYVQVLGIGGTAVSDMLVHNYKITSVGNANTTITTANLNNLNTSTVTFSSNSSGYIMHRIRRSDGQVVFTRQYDLANENRPGYIGYNSRDLASDLNRTSGDFVVALHTFGETYFNRLGSTVIAYRVLASTQSIAASGSLNLTFSSYDPGETLYWTIESVFVYSVVASTESIAPLGSLNLTFSSYDPGETLYWTIEPVLANSPSVPAVIPTVAVPDISLDLALYRCGASPGIFANNTIFVPGGAYALVGIPGVGAGHGIEIFSGQYANDPMAFASIDFRIRQGSLTPIATQPPIVPFYSLLASAESVDAAAVLTIKIFSLYPNQTLYLTIETATADDLARVYQYPRTFNLDITNTLSTVNPARSALLVPRLYNGTVRKLRTSMKFDRIATRATTTPVYDWVTGGYDGEPIDYQSINSPVETGVFDRTYAPGTLLRYQGQAYRVLRETASGPVFPFGNMELIGSDVQYSDPRYLHGYFTNANERILAYYQPSADMVPLELNRLVPGVGTIVSSAQSTSINYTETVLVGDTFSSTVGISPGNIQLVGGGFVDSLFSYAPEELLPGSTYDVLSIKVITNSATNTGFRISRDISGNVFYHNVSPAYTTILAQDLNITDANIVVADGTVLPPTATGIEPRVIYINGERIAYRTRNANILTDLRRSYGGTGVPLRHQANSNVEVISITTEFPAPTLAAAL